ncbi:MAG: hypothetical protein AMXMBFR84_37860 [Candidatus Hydrogenedentota bacterium]
MGILYYFPGQKEFNKDKQSEIYGPLGLADVLEGTSPNCRICYSGPDGNQGVVVAPTVPGRESATVLYKADAQTWQECAGFWIGYWNEHKPKAADLARKQQMDGYWCTDAQGDRWIAPCIRVIDGSTKLPEIITLSPDGAPVREIAPGYRAVHDRAMENMAALMSEEAITRDELEWLPDAADAIALNYHVGKWELSLLRVLDTRFIREVVEATIDMPRVLAYAEALKKNSGDLAGTTSESSDGQPGT